ncbi:MAG: hypothetical protein OSB70_05625 [Myxococcota bacterium]|nr:hypothetical protein [Myxococcota bacterium]
MRRVLRGGRGRGLGFSFLAFGLALGVAGPARADLGGLVAQGTSGPFELTVLAAPWPLRAGPSEWRVLVKDTRTGQVRRDLVIHLALGSEPVGADAPGGLARLGTHPGYYSVSARVDKAGPVWGRVRVEGPEGATGSRVFTGRAEPARGAWGENWAALLFPFGLLAIFAWHQVRRLSRGNPVHGVGIEGDFGR